LNPIALAIPFFLVAIAVEWAVARRRGLAAFRTADAVADLGCGVGQQVALVFFGGALLAGYQWLLDHLALVRFPPGSPWPWVIALVWVDFAYYWWHRLSHEVSVLWAVHAVHHQSEDYNLAVALRQAVLSTVTSFPFYAPMALAGVPTLVYAGSVAISTLYQFWIHTELVGKLGPAELVLNTPSAHRVHHAVNPRYLDRNYAAILIVWDRLFGTYVEERERPVYGVSKPLRSFDPVWAQLQPWAEIAARARRLTGLDRLRVWWRSPAWDPSGAHPLGEEEVQARPKHETPASPGVRRYALLQFAPLVVVTFLMLLGQRTASPAWLAVGGGVTLWTLVAVGALLDGRRWAVPVEAGRVAVLLALAAAWLAGGRVL
jgi:sterol desaturase/sphingolipid hydroxylase (fatty acid hydroxylase superfamily)